MASGLEASCGFVFNEDNKNVLSAKTIIKKTPNELYRLSYDMIGRVYGDQRMISFKTDIVLFFNSTEKKRGSPSLEV